MSVASILKVYDGLDPELAFPTAAPGTAENIAQVLANAPAGVAGGLPLTDVGAFSCDSISSVAPGLFTIAQATAGQGIALTGAVGASLTATTGGASVTATAGGVQIEAGGGVLKLDFDGVGGQLNIVPLAAQFSPCPIAAAKPNWLVAQQLQIQVGGTNYWIPMSTTQLA
jgi:hypothetical protein